MKSSNTGQRATEGAPSSWNAPEADGGLLIWPAPPSIATIARQNASQLAAAENVCIGGAPLPELRRAARDFIGHRGEEPLIATGHQAELAHPGVWVKNAVICAAADACGGRALHVAVDTDAPKHLKLRWPGFAAPISDDARISSAPWAGLLDPPTPAHLERLLFAAESARHEGRVSPLVGEFLRTCRTFLVDQRDAIAPLNLAAMLVNAQHAQDWELGLRYDALLLSGLLDSEPWARFVCGIAADARGFASAYNAALADYRRAAGIDSSDRPAPDLVVMGERVEVPFWMDDLVAGRRHRAELIEAQGGFALAAPNGSGAFPFSKPKSPGDLVTWLRARQLRLAPRALTLTMFLRLCVCDLFVHGIGGGLYDQVTDRIIREWFGIEPPAFAVATATLYHPLAAGRERICMQCLRHEEHALSHRVLGDAKRVWLERIGAARDARERRVFFEQMHEARRKALSKDSAYLDSQQRISAAERQLAQETELFDREMFYAIQPRERLAGLIERVRGEFAEYA